MRNFTSEYCGVVFKGVVLTHGPYGDRLSVAPADPEAFDAESDATPDDAWVSAQTGEDVQYWTEGEGDGEVVYLPVTADKDAAENTRRMFG